MIDAKQATCKHCGKPVPQKKGKRKREYCNNVCKQLAYNNRKQGKAESATLLTDQEQVQTRQLAEEREQRYRGDTASHHFKKWLRQQHRPADYGFIKRILDDTRLPLHGSRGTYVARLRLYNYSAEDIYLFEEIWKDMLFSKS